MHDPVNHPAHYTDGQIEVIDFIDDKQLSYCLGNAVKYISRAGKKDPATSIRGWDFPWGSTGMSAIGDGYFYISHNGITPKDKQQYTRLILYKWIGNEQVAFELCR